MERPRIKTKPSYPEEPVKIYETTKVIAPNQMPAYEPSKIGDTYDSTFWQWRRVIAWERYLNDPLDKIKIGTM